MFKFLRKHKTIFMTSLAACFIGLLLFGIGGGSLVQSPYDTAFKINGKKVAQVDFDRMLRQLTRQQGNLTPEQQKQAEAEAIRELVRLEMFYEESKKYGVKVPDMELKMRLSNMPAFQKNGQFDGQAYAQTITQVLGMPLKDFERDRRKEIAGEKLNALIFSSVHVPEAVFQDALQRRLAIETDTKKKKELLDNPEILRNELRNQEAKLVFDDWLAQINTKLNIQPVSTEMKKRLASNG